MRRCTTAAGVQLVGRRQTQRRLFADVTASDLNVPTARGSLFDLGAAAPSSSVGSSDPISGGGSSAAAAAFGFNPRVAGAFTLYGEADQLGADDPNRLFASSRTHSHDAAALYSALRQPEADAAGGAPPAGKGAALSPLIGGAAVAPLALRPLEDENDAVMREGRDKQGAAGAAVVAAAMLETRRGADAGVAMVPGHPLPVVFPRQDGAAPAVRFAKKLGPGIHRLVRARQRQRRPACAEAARDDGGVDGEVVGAGGRITGHSMRHSVLLQVRVLDEHRRFLEVQQHHHFAQLSDAIPTRLGEALAADHFTEPTLLQSAAVPLLMAGEDVVCVAPSGSGRTIAFAVPALSMIMRLQAAGHRDSRQPLVLVLCPTRGAVQRTAAAFSSLADEDVRVVAAHESVVAGAAQRQEAALARGCEVLVATPPRVQELLAARRVSLDSVLYATVDEADRIMATGQGPELQSALRLLRLRPSQNSLHSHSGSGDATPRGGWCQLSVWSCAVSSDVAWLTRQYSAASAKTVLVRKEEETNVNVRQVLYPLRSREERLAMVQRLYDRRVVLRREQVLLYCVFKETAESLAAALADALSAPPGLVQCVHSGMRSRRRAELLSEFKSGSIRVLVGTDVTLHRLDAPDLAHVISYELPPTTEAFARRVAKVGRAGRQGTAHTLLCLGDARLPATAQFIAQQTGHPLSAEIDSLVRETEAMLPTHRSDADGGVPEAMDEWSTRHHPRPRAAACGGHWRVRGRRDGSFSYAEQTAKGAEGKASDGDSSS